MIISGVFHDLQTPSLPRFSFDPRFKSAPMLLNLKLGFNRIEYSIGLEAILTTVALGGCDPQTLLFQI